MWILDETISRVEVIIGLFNLKPTDATIDRVSFTAEINMSWLLKTICLTETGLTRLPSTDASSRRVARFQYWDSAILRQL